MDLDEQHKAIECHEQSLAISRNMGEDQFIFYCLGNIGNAWAKLGESRKAIMYYEQVLETARVMGDPSSEG